MVQPPRHHRTTRPWFCSPSYNPRRVAVACFIFSHACESLLLLPLLLACCGSVFGFLLPVLGCCRRVHSRQDRVLRAGWWVLTLSALRWCSMKVERGAAGVEVTEAAGSVVPGVVPPAKRRRVAVAPTAAGGRRGGGSVGRRARRRVQADATAVQRLFQACRAVFRGPGTVPAPAEVDLLRAMIDRVRPEDVGLSSDLKFFRSRDAADGTPIITHSTIYKCENFSMVILILPPNAVIPLHNHPGMTVFSKLLLGSMHIKSYDWVDPDPAASGCSSPDDQLRLAKLVVDDVFTAPCDPSVLYPTTGGNMHQFRAIATCAVLDILGPPYSIEEDRDCTYYTDIPYSHHSMTEGICDLVGIDQEGHRLAWLKEIDMPRELKMCNVHYGGPPISDK